MKNTTVDLATLEQIFKFLNSQASKIEDVKSFEEDPEVLELIKAAGNSDPMISIPASYELAKAVTEPIRDAIPHGDITSNIYTQQFFGEGQAIEYMTMIQPGEENDFVATTISSEGAMPETKVAGNYTPLQTYEYGATITTWLRFIRNARFDVIGKLTRWLAASVVRKNNRDGFHAILGAANSRGLSVSDSQAASGFLTKRLINLAIVFNQRNGGGNVNSQNQKTVTDFWFSPEAVANIREWDLTQIDDVSRREIYMSDESDEIRIFKKWIHATPEFGADSEFDVYWTDTLGAAVPGSKSEIGLALDLTNKSDVFVNPVREYATAYSNALLLHPENKWGMYVRGEHGWGVLDNRHVLILGV